MSYSRWSNSIWYTYNSSSLENYIRDEQVFTICMVYSFTYKELKHSLEECLDTACHYECHIIPDLDGQLGYRVYREDLKPTPEQREELKGYMLRFIKAVENDKELQ